MCYEIFQAGAGELTEAGAIHAAAWRESHKDICAASFLAIHTAERQRAYLAARMAEGAELYLLRSDGGKGIVTVNGNLIADLYVLPEEQGKGYGTALLRYAMARCAGAPELWVLSHNVRAISLYERHGFARTGELHALSPQLTEIQMRYKKTKAD